MAYYYCILNQHSTLEKIYSVRELQATVGVGYTYDSKVDNAQYSKISAAQKMTFTIRYYTEARPRIFEWED